VGRLKRTGRKVGHGFLMGRRAKKGVLRGSGADPFLGCHCLAASLGGLDFCGGKGECGKFLLGARGTSKGKKGRNRNSTNGGYKPRSFAIDLCSICFSMPTKTKGNSSMGDRGSLGGGERNGGGSDTSTNL